MSPPQAETVENEILSVLSRWLAEPLFSVGDTTVSASGLIKLLVFLILLAWGARLLRRLLVERIFPRARIEVNRLPFQIHRQIAAAVIHFNGTWRGFQGLFD